MKNRVFILSAGLGNISRGFEISAKIWYDALSARDSEIKFELFAGGKIGNAKRVANIARDGAIARGLRKINLLKDGCRLEQLSFSVGLLPYLFKQQPDVIWLQEGNLATMLLKFKKIFGFRYKIMFCDGAPMGYAFAKQFDFLIFLEKFSYQQALSDGFPIEKVALIPHLTLLPQKLMPKIEARKALGIPADMFVIICVAAWNKHHKRIDYLIKEFAKLKNDNALLLLCGQPEAETDELKKLANDLEINVQWKTLSQPELATTYDAADLFILPSLDEGLGVVMIEAGMHHLPVIAHPHKGSKYILGDDYPGLADLSKEGNLAEKITAMQKQGLAHIGEITGELIEREFEPNMLISRFKNFIKSSLS